MAQPLATKDTSAAHADTSATPAAVSPVEHLVSKASDTASRDSSTAQKSGAQTDIAIVDGSIPDAGKLAQSLQQTMDVYVVHGGDGWAEMAQALAGRTNIDAIHIFSHGSDGAVMLGDAVLDQGSLSSHAGDLATIGATLKSGGDILIYGCDVAETASGKAFVRDVASATGADVAASTDLTGAVREGGNWTLEYATGTIDAAEPMTALSGYDHFLPTGTISYSNTSAQSNVTSGLTYSGTLGSFQLDCTYGATQASGDYIDYLPSGYNFTNISGSTANVSSTHGYLVSDQDVALGSGYNTSLTFKSADGSEFSFEKVWLADYYGYETSTSKQLDVTGYRNGTQVASANFTFVAGDNYERAVNQGDELSSAFNNVDKVVITDHSGGSFFLGFNDITLGNAVLPNTAPVLSTGGRTLSAINEDPTVNAGTKVSTLLTSNGGTATDADGNTLGIAVNGDTSSNGTWQYSIDGTNWSAIGTVADTSALLLTDSDYLRFVPNANYNGTGTGLSFRAWDQTSGTHATKVNASTNGGSTPFSSTSAAGSVTVNPVHDAPGLSGNLTLTAVNEDVSAPAGRSIDQLLTDSSKSVALDNDGSTFAGIAITGDAANATTEGHWQYSTDGTNWYNVDTVAVSSTSALVLSHSDSLRFVPAANYNGTPGGLTVRALDSTYAGSFTSGATRATTNATTNGGTTAIDGTAHSVGTSITAVNDAPVLTAYGPMMTRITEDATNNGGDLVSALLGSSVTDVDTSAVQGIAITGLNSGTGTWQYSTDAGSTWNSVGTVSGTSALLLRATDKVRFVPDGKNGDRVSFTYHAWDQTSGTAGSKADVSTDGGTTAFSTGTDTARLTVTSVNDAPVLTAQSPTLTGITENDTTNGGDLVSSLLGSSVSDVDRSAVQGIAITGLTSSTGTWQFSTDGGSHWSTVGTVSGSSALLLRSTDKVRFVPDGKNGTTASFTYRAWDQTSGTAGTKADTSTNGGTTAFSTATDSAAITVSSVNDAPVLTPQNPTFTTITENATNNSGETVSTLLGSSISDVDTSAAQGIAITGLNAGNGNWQYSLDGGSTWNIVGTVSGSSALLLKSTDKVRFLPDAKNGTSANVTYRAWDQTSGTHGTKADVSTNGNTTAFSTATDTASITVTSVNDAPSLSGGLTLNSIYQGNTSASGRTINQILGDSSVTFDDVDTGSSLSGVAIVSDTANNSTEGTWQYSTDSGNNWYAIGSVSDGTTALALSKSTLVRFVPANGTYIGTPGGLTLRALDNTFSGSFTSGGSRQVVDTSHNGATLPISSHTYGLGTQVLDINDAPVLTAHSPTMPGINEDATSNGGELVSGLLGSSVTDADTGAVQGIAITGLSSGTGTWQFSTDAGSTWNAVGTVSGTSALLLRATDKVRFVPDGKNGTTASFTYRAWDQTSGIVGTKADASTNGGITSFSTATDAASITVSSVNDAPVLAAHSPTLVGIAAKDTGNGGDLVSSLLGSSVNDVDTGAVQGMAITGLNSGNGTWQFSTDGGSTWSPVGTVSATSALLLRSTDKVRFVPDGKNGTTASFTYQAWDQTSGTAGLKVDATTTGGTGSFSTATDTASITVDVSVSQQPSQVSVLPKAPPALISGPAFEVASPQTASPFALPTTPVPTETAWLPPPSANVFDFDSALTLEVPTGRAFSTDLRHPIAFESDQSFVQLTLANGSPLPSWLSYDPVTGVLKGTPPPGFHHTLDIRMTTQDAQGHKSVSLIHLDVGDSGHHPTKPHGQPMRENAGHPLPSASAGKPALESQFAAHRPAGGHRGKALLDHLAIAQAQARVASTEGR